MAIDDDSYESDQEGRYVLIGLTAEETIEFISLDAIISDRPQLETDEQHSPNERRWLVLYEKHAAALEPFSQMCKTKH